MRYGKCGRVLEFYQIPSNLELCNAPWQIATYYFFSSLLDINWICHIKLMQSMTFLPCTFVLNLIAWYRFLPLFPFLAGNDFGFGCESLNFFFVFDDLYLPLWMDYFWVNRFDTEEALYILRFSYNKFLDNYFYYLRI